MKLNGISTICFDAGNTLLYCDPSPAEIYATHLSRLGRTVNPEDVGPIFAEAWSEMQQRKEPEADRYGSVPGGERAWWGLFVRDVLERLDHDAPWEPLLDNLYDAFSDQSVWKVFDDTFPTLESLAARDLRLAVISNWDRRLPTILHALGLSPHFETITVSAIEGVEKPSPEIFTRTLERLQISAAETLYVGDSPLEDYTGAREAGLNAILIDRRGLFEGTEYDRVASLNEIIDLVA